MARFEPFAGLRYDTERVALSDVLAPPYDVVDEPERAHLEARSPYNAVWVELGRQNDDPDRHQDAGRRLDEWTAEGILRPDPEPCFYVYRMGWRDEAGAARQTTGVVGALELSPPGEGQVLPHERTMGRPRDDRLRLLRATRANISPVWCLSLADGLSTLLEPHGPPVARATDEGGVHHRLWRITESRRLEAVADAVASAPVVIADGHHRYETALAYRDERRAASRGERGDFDLLMAFVVELTPGQVTVRPIHRLLAGLPPGFDLAQALAQARSFDLEEVDEPPSALPARMAGAGALALLTGERTWLLRPRLGEAGEDGGGRLPDAAVLDEALAALPDHDIDFHHSVARVAELVRTGKAQAGLLLRPATVDQIAATARAGQRMPPKTTFFTPKPGTGLVFRRLAG